MICSFALQFMGLAVLLAVTGVINTVVAMPEQQVEDVVLLKLSLDLVVRLCLVNMQLSGDLLGVLLLQDLMRDVERPADGETKYLIMRLVCAPCAHILRTSLDMSGLGLVSVSKVVRLVALTPVGTALRERLGRHVWEGGWQSGYLRLQTVLPHALTGPGTLCPGCSRDYRLRAALLCPHTLLCPDLKRWPTCNRERDVPALSVDHHQQLWG